MPELGVNAIYKAAKAIGKLEAFDLPRRPHQVMGKPTLNVGTLKAATGVNAVPDAASFGVDIRTVPGMDHEACCRELKSLLGEAELDVFSEPEAGVDRAGRRNGSQRVFEICKPVLGEAPSRAPRRT